MRIFFVLLGLLLATPALAAPRIVVSIAPIHSLVAALTKGICAPQLLLSQGGSPHSASLRPSQARALSQADLLIWVGPELESFLSQSVKQLVRPGAEMRLLTLAGLRVLPQRKGGFWEQEDDHSDGHQHGEQGINPHIWLSPANAKQISRAISKRLSRIDPAKRSGYEQNLALLLDKITDLQKELSLQLQPLQDRPYLVFHDAYPYFEQAFSLNAVGSVRVSAERAPGARRLQQIQTRLKESHAICLFSEPQFSPALAHRLTAGSHLRLGVLDPLGKTADSGEDAWFILMRNLARNLRSCLADR